MKIRKGFVSNSSSSSFIIDLRGLNQATIEKVIGFEKLMEGKMFPEGVKWDDLAIEEKAQSTEPLIGKLSDKEFEAAKQLDGIEEWTMKSHAKDPNILFVETDMDNGLFQEWCSILNIDETRWLLYFIDHDEILNNKLIGPYMPLVEIEELFESQKYKKQNIGCYLDLRENIDYEKDKLINHLKEAFNLPGTNHFFIPRERETYQSWNIEAHPDNKDIFLCWSSAKNDFPFIDWCFHIGIKPRDVYFYKYYKEKPPILAITDIEDRKFERMY